VTLTEQLQRVVELAEKATPGKWHGKPNKYETEFRQLYVGAGPPSNRVIAYFHASEEADDEDAANVEFIANARTSAPALARAWLLVLPALERWESRVSDRETDRALLTAFEAAKAELGKLGER
jgi:hypothetical protein